MKTPPAPAQTKSEDEGVQSEAPQEGGASSASSSCSRATVDPETESTAEGGSGSSPADTKDTSSMAGDESAAVRSSRSAGQDSGGWADEDGRARAASLVGSVVLPKPLPPLPPDELPLFGQENEDDGESGAESDSDIFDLSPDVSPVNSLSRSSGTCTRSRSPALSLSSGTRRTASRGQDSPSSRVADVDAVQTEESSTSKPNSVSSFFRAGKALCADLFSRATSSTTPTSLEAMPARVNDRFHHLFDKAENPQAVCVDVPGRFSLTYGEVCRLSKILAKQLQIGLTSDSVSRDERGEIWPIVGLALSPSSRYFLPAVVAVSRVGGVAHFLTDVRVAPPKDRVAHEARNHKISEGIDIELTEQGCHRIAGGTPASSDSRTDPPSSDTYRYTPSTDDASASRTPFLLMHTGGTRSEKCAVVTHGMIIHESEHYRKLLPECVASREPGQQAQARVAVSSNLFWPANVLGQISLALALSGICVVLDERNPRQSLRAGLVSVFGAVPRVLRDVYCSQPERFQHEFPHVKHVICWGGDYDAAYAKELVQQGISVLNVLIATEYPRERFAESRINRTTSMSRPVFLYMQLPAEGLTTIGNYSRATVSCFRATASCSRATVSCSRGAIVRVSCSRATVSCHVLCYTCKKFPIEGLTIIGN